MSIRSTCTYPSTSVTTIGCNRARVVFYSPYKPDNAQVTTEHQLQISQKLPSSLVEKSSYNYCDLLQYISVQYNQNRRWQKLAAWWYPPSFELYARVAYENLHKILWLLSVFLHEVIFFGLVFFDDFLLGIRKKRETLRPFSGIHKVLICSIRAIQKTSKAVLTSGLNA